jgi:hypothetical protein
MGHGVGRHTVASVFNRLEAVGRRGTSCDERVAADELVAPWFRCLHERLPRLRLFDCHTHLGADPDNSRQSPDELAAALDVIDGRAVTFAFSQPDGYRSANDRVLSAARESGGRLVPFCRASPNDEGRTEVERAVAKGAAGIKLHPRAERFSLADDGVDRIAQFAAERRLPVIVHAGRGIPTLGRDALVLAERYPELPVILAHAAITDLAWIWREAPAHRNLFFDTAWWNTADHLALFSHVPPGQILFGSDIPYGRTVAAAAVALRGALAAGLGPEQAASVAGGQLECLLAGDRPRDLGAAPAQPVPAAGPLLERVHTLLVAAAARMTTGRPGDEYVDLARLACALPGDHPDAPAAASVAAILERYEGHRATGARQIGPRPPGIHLIFVAAAVARTPWLPLPAGEIGA